MHICMMCISDGFCLSESGARPGGAEAGAELRLRGMLRQCWQACQNYRQFSVCCLHTGIGSKEVCGHAVQEHSSLSYSPSISPIDFQTS